MGLCVRCSYAYVLPPPLPPRMPAASTVDGKSGVLGSGKDAGARRRASQKGGWEDGDFGYRQ